MKQVQVTFKAQNGNTFTRGVNTSGSAKLAANALAASFKDFEMVAYKVIKEW